MSLYKSIYCLIFNIIDCFRSLKLLKIVRGENFTRKKNFFSDSSREGKERLICLYRERERETTKRYDT